jgi:hypothetical protein
MKRGRLWRWFGLGLGAVLLYLVFLLVFAPATYFARLVAWASRDSISIHQPRGTLWQGAGTLSMPRAPQIGSGELEWSLQTWPLLLGRGVIQVHYRTHDIDLRATARVTPTRYGVDDLSATVPARLAALIYPPAEFLGLAGQLRLSTDSVEFSADEIRGTALVRWEAAASNLLSVKPAGNYRLQLDGRDKAVQLKLSTEQGTLLVSANGAWQMFGDGGLQVQGTVTTATPQPALEPMLNALGPPQADGQRSFNYTTRLTNPLAAWSR